MLKRGKGENPPYKPPKKAMAIYRLSINIINRTGQKSSLAASAYRAEEKLKDEQKNRSFNYSNKNFCLAKEVILPPTAPVEYSNRSKLWNAVEKAENRCDAQLSREFQLALPKELGLKKQIALVHGFCQKELVSKGMICDIAIHNERDGNGNFHAHVMATTRTVNPNGFGLKNREWNKKALVYGWRKSWANEVNLCLEQNGIQARVNCERLVLPITKTKKIKNHYRERKLENEIYTNSIISGIEKRQTKPSPLRNDRVRSSGNSNERDAEPEARLFEGTTKRLREQTILALQRYRLYEEEREKKLEMGKSRNKPKPDIGFSM